MISRRTIDIVLETARIEEVVGDYVALKRRGASYLGLCPFHNEKTPSFNVSASKGIYKCFGCGASGNAVGFVMEHDKLSFPEAIKQLAVRYNIEVEETIQHNEAIEEQKEKESMLLINTFAGSFLQEQLLETDEGQSIALSYFKERGFSDETIKKFELGYSPDKWSVFTDYAIKAGYKLDYLIKTGLTVEKDGKHFDRFRGRVMFPIHNVSGKIIAFGGRILSNDKKTAKYVNSPESEVYYKSKALYGIHLARKKMIEQNLCYLVEGYTDVISLHQVGIENVVASSGTSLTEDQIKIINRYTKNITILYDGDAAGIKASFRGINMILAQGMNVKIVLFPDGNDPDSFARKNSPLFVESYLKDEAKDFIDFKINVLKEEVGNDPIKKAAMIREIVDSIALIPDPIIRNIYAKDCAKKIDTEEGILLSEISKLLKNKRKKEEQSAHYQITDDFEDHQTLPPEKKELSVLSSSVNAGDDYQESTLIRILLQYANKEIYLKVKNEQDVEEELSLRVGDLIMNELVNEAIDFKNPVYNRMIQLFDVEEGQDYPTDQNILMQDDQEIVSTAISLISNKHELSVNWEEKHKIIIAGEEGNLKKAVYSALYSFKIRKVEELERNINNQLNAAMEIEQMDDLLTQLKSLLDLKQILGKELQYVVMR